MTPEQKQSLIRHAITLLGGVATLLGLGKFIGVFEYLSANFDILWAAGVALVGAVVTIYGFFKNTDRFATREEIKTLLAKK